MNTGMQDAFNLGWKLAAVVSGGADPLLLDSYQAERHPIAARVIEQTTRMTDMGTLDHRVQQVLRNSALHLAGRLAPVRHLLAAQLTETDLTYRHSPIVAGDGHRSGVRPGDSAPEVPGTELRERLVAAGGSTVALVFGDVPTDQALAGAAAAPDRRDGRRRRTRTCSSTRLAPSPGVTECGPARSSSSGPMGTSASSVR